MRFIKSSEKRKIVAELNEIYGITELPYLLIERGKKRLRAFSGTLSKEEILNLSETIRIENIGIYLISRKDEDIRLSFDAVSLLRKQITKNIIELNEEQTENWLRGLDIEIKVQRGIIILKHGEDLIGFGKSNGEKIFNYIPKERKLKSQFLS